MHTQNTLIGLAALSILFMPQQAVAFVGGENWDYEAAEAGVDPSYTLPVLRIDTENGAVIDQKDNYIDATGWLDTSHLEGVEGAGSPDAPLKLGIRGRGNATWVEFDKKPYKIKFDKKQTLLGMPKNKHYALLHCIGAFSAYFAHPLGMEIGKHLINGWTPTMTPVEVVLNGQYIGLYVLAETVRIDDGRVDIFEQPADNEDPAILAGGYLVEIDNYLDENQLVLWENPTTQLYVTVDTPEPMGPLHRDFLTTQFNAMTEALYNPDKLSRDWEDLIDADSYARHFVVEEIMNNQDAYNGSVKMFKDLDSPWNFGPLWDVGDSFDMEKEDFTFNTTPYRKTWIPQTYRFPRFVKRVQQVWSEFRNIDDSVWTDFLSGWNDSIEQAEVQNQKVWKYYRGTSTTDKMSYTADRLAQHVAWLDNVWGNGPLTRNVSVFIEGNGTATLGGHEFADVDVFAGDDLELAFAPAQGFVLRSLRVNGVDCLDSVQNGTLTLSAIDSDTTVDVEFAQPSSISEIAGETPVWSLNGNTLTSSLPARVYNAAGALVGSGYSVSLPAGGIYIVKAGDKSGKIVL